MNKFICVFLEIATLILAFVLGFILTSIVGKIVATAQLEFNEDQEKKECYEIYVEDKVILNKCKKYLEKKGGNNEK